VKHLVPIKVPLLCYFKRFLIFFWRSPTTGLLASKVKKHFYFLIIYTSPHFKLRVNSSLKDSVSLNPSFSRVTPLWLVRWPSLLGLVYAALFDQMTQSVVIGQLFSDWSDDPAYCDWSIRLWLVRWISLLWLVYSALIGQMTQPIVIGLLCSDWSDGPVCCDWSTLLWLVRWPSLL